MENVIGFVYWDGERAYVLDMNQAAKKDEFVPPNAKHTATVATNIILERILNEDDGWEDMINDMRSI